MRNAYHINERRQVKMNNEEQIIKEKYGYNAKDMQEQMLLFMKNDTSSLLKDIAHLIETKQCSLVWSSEKRYHDCSYCHNGGGSWIYDYETPARKLPFQLFYVYAPSCHYNTVEEKVEVVFYNREEEIRDDIEDAIKGIKIDASLIEFYKEQSMQRKYGSNAMDVRSAMLIFMEKSSDSHLKNIAHLIQSDKCKLIGYPDTRHQFCPHCKNGGGSWFYNYETPTKKLPFSLIYLYSPFSQLFNARQEHVLVFYYNRKEEIMDDIEKTVKHLK